MNLGRLLLATYNRAEWRRIDHSAANTQSKNGSRQENTRQIIMTRPGKEDEAEPASLPLSSSSYSSPINQ